MRETRWQLSQSTGSLTIRAVRLSDKGSYNCIVNSLAYSPIMSSPAQLTVLSKWCIQPVTESVSSHFVSTIIISIIIIILIFYWFIGN